VIPQRAFSIRALSFIENLRHYHRFRAVAACVVGRSGCPPLDHLPVVGLIASADAAAAHPTPGTPSSGARPLARHSSSIESDLNSLARLSQILTCRSSPEPGHYSSPYFSNHATIRFCISNRCFISESHAALSDTAPNPLRLRIASARGRVPGSVPSDRPCPFSPLQNQRRRFGFSSIQERRVIQESFWAFRTARPRTIRRTPALAPCQISETRFAIPPAYRSLELIRLRNPHSLMYPPYDQPAIPNRFPSAIPRFNKSCTPAITSL